MPKIIKRDMIVDKILSAKLIDSNGTKYCSNNISNVKIPEWHGDMIVDKILSAKLIDSNGTKYCFDNISNVKMTNTMELFNREMTVSFDVLPNKNNEYCTIIIPDKGEKELNGTIIYCRFETTKGGFNEHTPIYAYYAPCKPEDCVIKIGTIFKIWDTNQRVVKYNNARLRCEDIIGVKDKSDAEIIVNRKLLNIEEVIIGEDIICINKRNIGWNILNKIENIENDNLLVGFTNVSGSSISETDYINEKDKTDINNLGGNKMNTNIFSNMFKNMKFGKINDNDIKYSMEGIAFKTTDNDYVCYKPDFTFTNVANMVIDMPIFAIPVSKNQIKAGDVIRHNDAWVIVNEVYPSEIKVAKPWTKEIVSIIPETSIFGFNFYTKIINPFENFGDTATAENPFGNIFPFMFMSGGDSKNSNDNLMMMLALGGGKIDFSNPMMMYMLMGDKGNTNDMLMMMMLSGNNPFEQKHECKCGCNVGDYVATPNTSIDPCFGVDFDWTKFAPRDETNINVNAMDIETDK